MPAEVCEIEAERSEGRDDGHRRNGKLQETAEQQSVAGPRSQWQQPPCDERHEKQECRAPEMREDVAHFEPAFFSSALMSSRVSLPL